MKAELDLFYNSIKELCKEDLIRLALSQHEELTEAKIRQIENSRIQTEVHIQYMDLCEKYEKLLDSYNAIAKDNALMHDRLLLNNKAIFGSHTEKTISILERTDDTFEDECPVEDICEEAYESKVVSLGAYKDKKSGNKGKPSDRKKVKKKQALKESAANLPGRAIYNLDVDALNREFGENNWYIKFWKCYETIKQIPIPLYREMVFEPVVGIKDDEIIISPYYEDKLIPHSLVSPSLMANILYKKFAMGLPFYRQSADFNMHGLALSRQTIIKWANTTVPMYLEPVSEYLLSLLVKQRYVQSDESHLLVLKDGRAPGTKSFMWVHCTSEMSDDNKIVIFSYEPTRSTRHLRKIFGDFVGYMTSDAYVSYFVMEKESCGCIRVCGCMMHARRYLSEALFVNDTTSMTEKELLEMPEVKALIIIRDIYLEERKLKKLTADERLKIRQRVVAPLVDKYFEYIHSLAASDEIFTDRMQKAIGYSINQEKYLRKFLEDGNIPVDNGQSERYIRAYSIGRANWIFADTPLGARVNAICYSLVETAKANNVNPEIYLTYLLEEVPRHQSDNNDDWKEDMTPWSDAYRQYEASQREGIIDLLESIVHDPERPVPCKTLHTPVVKAPANSA